MALTVWLLPETLDALSCHEASALRSTRRGLQETWLWRNIRVRSLAALERLPFDPRSWSLRRLELGVEALQGVHLLPSPSSLQELCLQHLLVPSVPYRGAVFGRFWELVAELPSLRTLELPDLICTAGGSETFASQLSKHLGTSLLRLRLHRAVLLECRSRESVAEAVAAQTRCWQVIARRLGEMRLKEVDITGAWRPIAPEHLRPWPPGRATNVEQVGTAENGIGEDSEELLLCEEDLLQLFETWCEAMSEINRCFPPGVVLHEDWAEEIRMAKARLMPEEKDSIWCRHELYWCQNVLSSFLEIGYDPDRPPELPKAQRRRVTGDLNAVTGRCAHRWPKLPASARRRKSGFVKNLVTAEVDLDRGDMVDKLIKYDEQRLAQAQPKFTERQEPCRCLEGFNMTPKKQKQFYDNEICPQGICMSSLSKTGENGAVAESLFSHGRRRTPLRTHLLKFLLNILSRSDPADTERPDDSRWAGQRRTDAMVESDWCVSDWCLRAERLGLAPPMAPGLTGPTGLTGPMGPTGPTGPVVAPRPMMARPLMRPMGMPVAGAALQAMGIPWMPPKRPAMAAAATDHQHKDWNSDDEEIDEFGRKKRRKVAKASQAKALVGVGAEEDGAGVCMVMYDCMTRPWDLFRVHQHGA
ncbi:unnamed protein product [Durusdinium trenchii]|uniref:Uncharacterized protein n=1 Tax=Durusdinium trenchii TaxID=1381693 RepID=A0ABP0JX45_9DINO